ncbi:hypothetical protein VTK73DRAFT_380 [Phialemonium thermophilum]|uniref:Uncharacterized protein n=1 Tax=Phialemonium thermophilum TaxID=223376 RepID=A0ABR3VVG9_9PEZI
MPPTHREWPSLEVVERKLQSLVQRHTALAEFCKRWAAEKAAAHTQLQVLLPVVERDAERRSARVQALERSTVDEGRSASSEGTTKPRSWGRLSYQWRSENAVKEGTGRDPAAENEVQVRIDTADDAAIWEDFLRNLDLLYAQMSTLEDRIGTIREALSELGNIPLRAPSRTTVQNHVRLLQEYNDVKDATQQLMGLVAQNLAVPVASLYESRRYGVGPED